MNRQYRVNDYLELIDAVNEWLTFDGLPPAITTDIICGFPGETDDDFQQTVDVAERVGYLHMHVFPFSPKQGTAAARWKDQHVPHHICKSRVREIIDMETDPTTGMALAYMRRLVGRIVRVMIEQPDPSHPDHVMGRCDHYAMVSLPVRAPRGTLVTAEITSASAEGLLGQPIDTRIALPVVA